MGYKVYENVINMELMWQMRQMIAEAAGMQLIEPRCRKPLFKRRAGVREKSWSGTMKDAATRCRISGLWQSPWLMKKSS